MEEEEKNSLIRKMKRSNLSIKDLKKPKKNLKILKKLEEAEEKIFLTKSQNFNIEENSEILEKYTEKIKNWKIC